ncbi:helix-turn-helix domain-containing protein [Streptomyces sp. NPDC085479]|uniref:helix-turn-helix domain-containing protein n=1 Tax=Streptomyces sp. NPDC085479 TaxID=3365726 RepID=UPI0037D7AA27
MEHTQEQLNVAAAIRGRVRELRGRSGLKAAELADRLVELGVPWNRSIVANFEAGRRPNVSVVEWLALAQVLNVAPVHLLVPPDAPNDGAYEVTPNLSASVEDVRAWVRGYYPIKSDNLVQFNRETPREEWGWIRPRPSEELEDRLRAVQYNRAQLEERERQLKEELRARLGGEDG